MSYSCSSWAWSAVIVTGGCRCCCRGTADFSSVFWCVGVKSDSGRRDSNSGSERSQPKTLTTALPSSDTSWCRVVVFGLSSAATPTYKAQYQEFLCKYE